MAPGQTHPMEGRCKEDPPVPLQQGGLEGPREVFQLPISLPRSQGLQNTPRTELPLLLWLGIRPGCGTGAGPPGWRWLSEVGCGGVWWQPVVENCC